MNFELESPIVGKNFSRNNVLGKRADKDHYETPYSMTDQLLEVENFGHCWISEPAAGHGAISGRLRAHGYEVQEDDLHFGAGGDFLASTSRPPVIVTNPPYKLHLEFILKAKEVCTWKFCLLLPTDYLHGKDRYDRIWTDTAFPLANVWTFVRRPMLGKPLRMDGTYGTGMQTYAWFVWDKFHRGPYRGGWIDNNRFVREAEQ